MKKGDYFEKIDYDLVDVDNIDPLYRYDYALDMLVWSQVHGVSHRCVQGRGAERMGRLLGHEEIPRRSRR